MDNKYIFASNLKKYMKLNDKTRKDICDTLGFNYYTFCDWVNAKKYPRIDKVEKLAEYFGISKSDLIEEMTIGNDPVGMAEKHYGMVMDIDLNDMYDDFKKLDSTQKNIVKNLVHSLAEQNN